MGHTHSSMVNGLGNNPLRVGGLCSHWALRLHMGHTLGLGGGAILMPGLWGVSTGHTRAMRGGSTRPSVLVFQDVSHGILQRKILSLQDLHFRVHLGEFSFMEITFFNSLQGLMLLLESLGQK